MGKDADKSIADCVLLRGRPDVANESSRTRQMHVIDSSAGSTYCSVHFRSASNWSVVVAVRRDVY